MNTRRRFWLIRFALLTVVVAELAALWWIDPARRISTEVLDLIPAGERDPELTVVRSLAGEQSARVVLFALELPAGSTKRAEVEAVFTTALQNSEPFAEVVAMSDASPRQELGRQLFAQRFDLLLPGWLAGQKQAYAASGSERPWSDWLAAQTALALEDFLSRPEALALQDVLPADPLLLMPGLMEAMPALPQPTLDPDGPVLVWARTRASPLSEEGQQPVFAAVAGALDAVHAIEPAAALQWSSIARFAAQSRQRIEQELSGLNLLSLLAVFTVGAVGLRQLLKAAHLAPVILGGLLGAWVVTLASFERVHVLVFVVGSLLAGVAVDYGFYLCLQPPAFPGESYGSRARRLLKPLLASALTTILGFSLLLFSELPLIRQLGVFVSAGLLCSLATALAWFAQVPQPFVETRAFARAQLPRTNATRTLARGVLLAAVLVGVIGPWTLHWHDDIRELEIAAPELRVEAAAVQARFGDDAGRATYLTHGPTPRAARQAQAEFQQWWQTESGADAPLASLALVLPTGEDFDAVTENVKGLETFTEDLRRELANRGFAAESFDPFVRDWDAWRAQPRAGYDEIAARLAGSLRGPASLLMSVSPKLSWIVSTAPQVSLSEPPAGGSTVSVRQLENLNRLFSRYRISALGLSSIGLAALGLSVLALYGVKDGWRIFAVPAGACLVAFGALGLLGQTLNLFHLLGAFLGVCLSHNYAIFSAENARRREERPPSVRLSAITTAASFGVLALSQIPVVAALGVTVAMIVLTALVIVELEPLTHGSAPAPHRPPNLP